MDILLDVDTQFDFINSAGKLPIPGADLIVPGLEATFDYALNRGMRIISTVDWHDADDDEFSKFPAHCVKNTPGAEKIPATKVYCDEHVAVFERGSFDLKQFKRSRQFIVQKAHVDVWDLEKGNPLAMKGILDIIKPDNIFVCGVATDICVLNAVKGLIGFGASVILITDAMKGLPGEDAALEAMSKMGADLMTSASFIED